MLIIKTSRSGVRPGWGPPYHVLISSHLGGSAVLHCIRCLLETAPRHPIWVWPGQGWRMGWAEQLITRTSSSRLKRRRSVLRTIISLSVTVLQLTVFLGLACLLALFVGGGSRCAITIMIALCWSICLSEHETNGILDSNPWYGICHNYPCGCVPIVTVSIRVCCQQSDDDDAAAAP